MAKKKKKDSGLSDEVFPSRKKVRYIGLPVDLVDVLQAYADLHSDENGKKSLMWAARVAVRKWAKGEGLLPSEPPQAT